MLEDGLVSVRRQGMPQGRSLSPLLVLLTELDLELERRGHRFCRYADECNLYVRSARARHRIMASITTYLETRLRLEVNTAKSAVDHGLATEFSGRQRELAPAGAAEGRNGFRPSRPVNLLDTITRLQRQP